MYCPAELDGIPHLYSLIVVSPQSFNPCNVHGISCRSLPVDSAGRPTTLTPLAGAVLIQRSATQTTPRPGFKTGAAHHVWPLVAYTMRINL